MVRLEKILTAISDKFNWVAAAAVAVMMLLTVVDVVMRLFKMPIPGTFEIVGMLGAVAISFSLAYTSIEKGHITVEVLMQKMPVRVQAFFTALYSLASAVFFLFAAWVCIDYSIDLIKSGEVSSTIKMPTYPFVLGISISSVLLALVLFLECFKSVREFKNQ
ncbi:MAG TPA: TRAP transporter small permease [Spirochaetota bacterium]|nr:TRAP transporter small permease [Spirochaetota bacterium]